MQDDAVVNFVMGQPEVRSLERVNLPKQKLRYLTSFKVDDPWRTPLSSIQKPYFIAHVPMATSSSITL